MSGSPPTIHLFPTEVLSTEAREKPSQRLASDEQPVLLPLRPPITTRVLHVINGEHYSGAERVQDLLAMQLANEGFGVDFAALKSGKFGEVRKSKVRLVPLKMRSRLDFRAVGGIKQLVHQHGYRILHAHTPRTALVTAIAARSLGVPWVYHVHSPVSRDSDRYWQNRINSWVEKFCLKNASRVVVVSPSLEPYMIERGVPASKIIVIPNGVPVCENVEERAPRTGPLVVGMVALFRPRKGTEVLLESLAAALSLGHDVRVRLIGGFETPEYEKQIRAKVEKLGIADQVEFTGFTTNVAGELAKLDVMVLPSLYGEGLPMVVLEAMAAGVPVIASHVEGASTAIEHRESGLLVEAGSVSQLTDAIGEFASGAIDCESLARCARERHREQFSDVAMARGMASVYHEMLEEVAVDQSAARDSRSNS